MKRRNVRTIWVLFCCLLNLNFITGVKAEGSDDKDAEISIKRSKYGYSPRSVIKKEESNIKSLMIGEKSITFDNGRFIDIKNIKSISAESEEIIIFTREGKIVIFAQ